MENIFSVTDVNKYINEMLDSDLTLSNIFIKGEISNYKKHSSGHHYFSLKDEGGVISAVMFKFDAMHIKTPLKDGMSVLAMGKVSSFVKSGQYQVYVKDIILDGVGDLHIKFEELKKKLYKEGMFEQEHKKLLPRFPEKIAIVTSKTGAAISDMLRVIENRYKLCEILIYPVLVQGEGAAMQIADAINIINNENTADVIIIGRGGGSIEDLWAFNDELLAHTIFASNIPIISAVGHEPDFTISDFVASVRAATPSNAAEICVPDTPSIKSFLKSAQDNLDLNLEKNISAKKNKLSNLVIRINSKKPINYINEKRMIIDVLSNRLQNPKDKVERYRQKVGLINQRLDNNYIKNTSKKREQLIKLTTYIDGFSPMKVLNRGYSYTLDNDKNIIKSIKQVQEKQEITTKLFDGVVKSNVVLVKGD